MPQSVVILDESNDCGTNIEYACPGATSTGIFFIRKSASIRILWIVAASLTRTRRWIACTGVPVVDISRRAFANNRFWLCENIKSKCACRRISSHLTAIRCKTKTKIINCPHIIRIVCRSGLIAAVAIETMLLFWNSLVESNISKEYPIQIKKFVLTVFLAGWNFERGLAARQWCCWSECYLNTVRAYNLAVKTRIQGVQRAAECRYAIPCQCSETTWRHIAGYSSQTCPFDVPWKVDSISIVQVFQLVRGEDWK